MIKDDTIISSFHFVIRSYFKKVKFFIKSTLPVVVIMLYYNHDSRSNLLGGVNLISSDVIRGYNDTIILSLLRKGDSYGYEISKQIEQLSEGNYIIKETTLYSAFARLEKNGYILSYSGNETNGRQRTYYKITSDGIAYYEEKRQEWQLTKDVINRFVEED